MARHALRELHPRHALLVPAAIAGSTVLLLIGLSLPLLYSQKMFWQSTYSVWTGVVELWRQNELALSAILFFF